MPNINATKTFRHETRAANAFMPHPGGAQMNVASFADSDRSVLAEEPQVQRGSI